MDYCAKESTLYSYCGEAVETPRVETSVKDQLGEITTKLYETDSALKSIINNLIGERCNEESPIKEERCMQDTLIQVNMLSEECMAMSHKIKELLF